MTKTSVRVYFKEMKKNDKRTAISLELKGDVSESKMMQLMNMAGGIVDVDFITPQTDIDDFTPEAPKGTTYTVNSDGTADVNGGQMEIEEALEEAQREAMAGNAEAAAGEEAEPENDDEETFGDDVQHAEDANNDALPFDDVEESPEPEIEDELE